MDEGEMPDGSVAAINCWGSILQQNGRIYTLMMLTYANMIFFPFSKVPPSNLPTAYPMYAPVTIVTGHFCHSRSLRIVSVLLSFFLISHLAL